MNRRRYKVRPLDRHQEYDAPVYDFLVINGVPYRAEVPAQLCLAIDDYRADGTWTFAINWLPMHMRSHVDSDAWAADAVKFLKVRAADQQRLAQKLSKVRRAA